MKQKKSKKFFLLYTSLFLLLSIIVFAPFLSSSKSFVWRYDGFYQHYNAFVYLGSYVRKVIKALFFEGRFVIPMWEFAIGYGGDIFTTLSYYVFGDPFALISVFTPAAYSEIGYAVAILLRFYIAGIAFYAYSRKLGCKKYSSFCAAFMYIFSAYAIFSGVRHPYFINPLINLPLILLGVEKLLKKERPTLYIFAIFISAMSNFYFFYILVLLTVIYVLARLLTEKENRKIKVLFNYFLKFSGFAIIGVAMAAVLFLPNVMSFLTNTRVSDAYTYSPLYYRSQYENMLGSFVSTNHSSPWAFAGVAPLAFIGVGAALLRKRENSWLKCYLSILIIFLLFPIGGRIFNGFGYVTNRWTFIFSFVFCLLFAIGYPELLHIGKSKKLALSFGCILYVFLCILFEKARTEEVMAGCCLLLIYMLILWCFDLKDNFHWKKWTVTKEKAFHIITLAMVIACIGEMSFYRYSFVERNYINEFMDEGAALENLTNNQSNAWKYIDDEEFYRIDNTLINNSKYNYLLTDGQSTTAMYWSLINPYITEYLGLNSAYEKNPYCLRGLLSRSMLLPLASAKYYVAGGSKAQIASVPYGFEPVVNSGGNTGVYKSSYSLPFGYTYNSVISGEEYNELTIAQRQQATLQSAVIQEDSLDSVSKLLREDINYTDRELPYKITLGSNTELEGNRLIVKENNASITLEINCPGNCELYTQFTGFSFESKPRQQFITDEIWEGYTDYQKNVQDHGMKYWTPATSTVVSAVSGDGYTNFTHFTSYDIYAHGRQDYLMNLNFSDQERKSIKITFSEKGIYTFEDLSVICQPMDQFEEHIDTLREDVLENVEILPNKITGRISLQDSKLLCLSLPYSKGWSIYVNGEKAELLRTNIMYSGVMLEEGEHDIELRYCTPYIKEGLALSSAGFVFFILSMFWYRRGNKKNI